MNRLVRNTVLAIVITIGLAPIYCLAQNIDQFEEPDSPSAWSFSNGPEYPGASGSVSQCPGHTGNGMCLSFDMTQGGNYVGATYNLPAPTAMSALSLWVKHAGGVAVEIRVQDITGQTLHFSPNRPFPAVDASQWYHLIVKLGQSDLHWGGANDGIVHDPIVAVSVLAKPTLDQTGNVYIDEVEAVPNLSFLLDPCAPALPTGVTNLNASAGVELEHIDTTTAGLNLAQALGFKWMRTEMFWTDVETRPGVYNFKRYDNMMFSLGVRKMKAHFILCYGNPLYTGGSWSQPPLTASAQLAFARFAAAAAAHYAGQGVQFEVWNEPDNVDFWPKPDPSVYAAVAASTIAQMHAADPTAKIAMGGLAGVDLGFLQTLLAADGAVGANAIALHPYRLEEPELLAGDLAETRSRLAATLTPHPATIWSTEAGYSSAWYGDGSDAANRTTQAKYGARQILTAAGLGIPFQVVFALHDHAVDFSNPEDNFGIVDNAYQPKPLTAAVRTALMQAWNMTLLGNLPSPETSLHILKFQGLTRVMLVLWSDAFGSDGRQVQFATVPASATDYLGNPMAFTTAGGLSTVQVSDSPVYVSFPLPGSD